MNECSGTVVVAFERLFVEDGFEFRGGPDEEAVRSVGVPTPWNQIEAAMAYVLKHPILVITEKGLRGGGLIDRGYDWYVLPVEVRPEACQSQAFLGVVEDWKKRVETYHAKRGSPSTPSPVGVDVASLTVSQIVASLKPAQMWAMLVAIVSLLGAAYGLGAVIAGLR